jgi:hypothetical protein
MTDLTFITNQEGENLRERFAVLIKDTQFFDVLVGYFFTSGFYCLLPHQLISYRCGARFQMLIDRNGKAIQ